MANNNDNNVSKNTSSTHIKKEGESKRNFGLKPSNNKRNNNRKKKYRNSNSTHTTSFKGNTDKLKNHVFQCYGEATSNTQFTRTCEELERFALTKYKFGTDIQYIIHNMTECEIKPPTDPIIIPPAKEVTATQKRIWAKEIDMFVMRESIYDQNKASMYAIIWGQCSPAMQAKLKTEETFF